MYTRGRWSTFATPRANRVTGVWSQPYRFSATRGLVRYRFRVLIPREASFPYETGASRSRTRDGARPVTTATLGAGERILRYMRRVRIHLSYANVMATVAVFIALGGTSYAVTQLPRNSVGSKQIRTRRRRGVGAAQERRALAATSSDRSVALRDISIGRAAVAPRPDGRDRPAGPAGPGGGDARGRRARPTGSIARSQGTAAALDPRDASGVYSVDFNRDMSTCYVAATIADDARATPPAARSPARSVPMHAA